MLAPVHPIFLVGIIGVNSKQNEVKIIITSNQSFDYNSACALVVRLGVDKYRARMTQTNSRQGLRTQIRSKIQEVGDRR